MREALPGAEREHAELGLPAGEVEDVGGGGGRRHLAVVEERGALLVGEDHVDGDAVRDAVALVLQDLHRVEHVGAGEQRAAEQVAGWKQ